MSIYADMILIINIIMNSTILLLTARIAGINYKWWRIISAAIIGSCYVLIGILPSLSMAHHIVFKILMSLILVVVAFGWKPMRIMVLWVTFFYVIAFILGGAVVGWLYLWQTSNLLGSCEMILLKISWENLVCGTAVGIFSIVIVLQRMLSRIIRQQNLYRVKFEYDGRNVELTGMLDTGNGLYTAIGHKPVIVVNQEAIEPILSEQTVAFLRNNIPELWLAKLNTCVDAKWLSRIQFIPYRAIGNQSILLAFRIDRLIVSTTFGCIDMNDAIVAIYNGYLSGDGTYTTLLHPQIINELNKTEGVSVCV